MFRVALPCVLYASVVIFNHRGLEDTKRRRRHRQIYPTFREFSENLEDRTFLLKEQISG
jgi:hypothetical protein